MQSDTAILLHVLFLLLSTQSPERFISLMLSVGQCGLRHSHTFAYALPASEHTC